MEIIVTARGQRNGNLIAHALSQDLISFRQRSSRLSSAMRSARRLDCCGGRPEKREPHELPSLPPAKSLNNGNGQLEDGIAKITATLGGEHRSDTE